MTDTTCTRYGYDDTGRYHVPAVSSNDHVSQTGNFPVAGNMDDQCPECRCSPGQPHAEDCPTQNTEQSVKSPHPTLNINITEAESCPGCNPVCVPLPLQTRLLEAFLLDEWVENLRAFAERHKDEIVDMTFQRLRDGFETYGSEMYGWSPERRTDEMCQEIADWNAYGSSGEVT